MGFFTRKERRKKHFEENVKGWKERECSACNGTGYYDHHKSPFCSSCNGTGKYKPNKEENVKAS